METKMVTVDASTMAKDIAATGHVALYGILFDTDKTEIKPESGATIGEIAKLLAQQPTVRLYVVGHTDNVGGYDYNVGLSQRRAVAVVQELTGKHGVQAGRLKPAGTGPLAPVAPNETEDGRARNRRVELVRQ
jgi:outer membrane protein OmpA-like peptidoglycan-associated protein